MTFSSYFPCTHSLNPTPVLHLRPSPALFPPPPPLPPPPSSPAVREAGRRKKKKEMEKEEALLFRERKGGKRTLFLFFLFSFSFRSPLMKAKSGTEEGKRMEEEREITLVTLQTKGESNDDNMLLPLYVYSRPTAAVLGKQWRNITTGAWWAGREMIPKTVFYSQKFEHKSACDFLVQLAIFCQTFQPC